MKYLRFILWETKFPLLHSETTNDFQLKNNTAPYFQLFQQNAPRMQRNSYFSSFSSIYMSKRAFSHNFGGPATTSNAVLH